MLSLAAGSCSLGPRLGQDLASPFPFLLLLLQLLLSWLGSSLLSPLLCCFPASLLQIGSFSVLPTDHGSGRVGELSCGHTQTTPWCKANPSLRQTDRGPPLWDSRKHSSIFSSNYIMLGTLGNNTVEKKNFFFFCSPPFPKMPFLKSYKTISS